MSKADFERGYQIGVKLADDQERYFRDDPDATTFITNEAQALLDAPEYTDEQLGLYEGYLNRISAGKMPHDAT